MVWLSLLLAVTLALMHLLAERLRFLRIVPRSSWLSAASGASVAYVFVHIFPELGAYQDVFHNHDGMGFLEHHVYVLSLVGFCVYYGLERAVQRYGPSRYGEVVGSAPKLRRGVFEVHVGSFALYYALIGYLLLHREGLDALNLLMYAVAMGMHFLVIDVGLSARHSDAYHRYGRWVLSLAVILGWALGMAKPLDTIVVGALFAFLAGGIVLNAIKEELPAERHSRFWAFAGGAIGFAVVLLLTVE